jgi:predicted acyl esterase
MNPFRYKLVILLITFLSVQEIVALTNKATYMVPMRDGIKLATDVYLPLSGKGPWPAILMRTPYSRKLGDTEDWVPLLIDLIFEGAYCIIMQDTRGRFDSEGLDSLYFSDGWGKVRDGYDTVEWIAEQSWSNGKIGMWGASALGMTQYFAAGAAPPHLTCCFAIVACSDLYREAIFHGGAYRRSLVDGWLIKENSEHLIDFFTKYNDYSSRYDLLNLSTRYDSVNVPIFHVGGWYDIFTQGVINTFTGLQKNGGPMAKGKQKLLMGPWVHDITTESTGELTFPESTFFSFLDIMINWFNYWLRGIENGVLETPDVQYYLMGDADQADGPGNRWVQAEDWPPEATQTAFYLREDRSLSLDPPLNDELPDTFIYNPLDPVPTIGGGNLNIAAGSYDQRSVESRPDVLVYTTQPLIDSLTVTGRIKVKLWASTDVLDTDFTAKLCDVYPDGRSMLLIDGIIQARHRNSLSTEKLLNPGEIYELNIDVGSTAIVFAPGHSIRLSISSSNYPRFEKNPNTGKEFRQDTTAYEIAHQSIFHNTLYPSALYLPVIGKSETHVLESNTLSLQESILEPCYPNPFNQTMIITISLPHNRTNFFMDNPNIILDIIDLKGRIVKHWTVEHTSGQQITLKWNGNDHNNISMPSGIYFCRLLFNDIIETQKVTLLR